jgi:hypothetical protein
MRSSRSNTTLALLLALAPLAACNGSARVRDILERPADFEGRTVSVSGTVVESANVIVLRFYKIDDGTGRIAVITKKAVPQKGASVTARGVVRQAFAIGDQSLTVLVEADK